MKLLRRISDLEPGTHKWLMQPPGGNVLQVNLKATYSPYVVVDPRHVAIDCYAGAIIRERSMFPWWNHWPVSQQTRSNGRWAVAPDRVSHSSLAHIQSWQPFEETDAGITMLMLNGLTDKSGAELLPLARSWLSPPALEVATGGFRSEGFDAAERAFVVSREGAVVSQSVQVTLRVSAESPLVKPAIVIRKRTCGSVPCTAWRATTSSYGSGRTRRRRCALRSRRPDRIRRARGAETGA
jgi:hypothetical protein